MNKPPSLTMLDTNLPEIMKPKPTSAFSEGECASPDELSKISFTSLSSFSLSQKVVSDVKNDQTKNSSTMASEIYSYHPDGTCIPILHTSTSRQGRTHQRWDRCEKTNSTIRLATGCIPITNDGRILFCSSSKKKEWILPKGGWETDERIEESAVREAYEEAGILGILGPRLCDVTFETRKEKKRRLETLKMQSSSASYVSAHESTTGSVASTEDTQKLSSTVKNNLFMNGLSDATSISAIPSPLIESYATSIDTTFVQKADAEGKNSSLSSSISRTHALVRVTFFPLYISHVLTEWPENGRSRKIFDIDEAIDTIRREELKEALQELRRRGLHIVTDKKSPEASMVSESEGG